MIQWLFIFTQNPHFTGQIESQNVWTPYKMGRMEYDFPEMWAVNQNVIQYSLRSIISCTPTLIMDRREYQFLLCPALLYAKTYTEGGNIGKCGLHFQ